MSMRRLLVAALLFTFTASLKAGLPLLKVADDHRHLVTEDGKPFFYLGDTAWELFHRLTREEADAYLTRRAQQGFNVIHAVALAEYDVSTPNAYGDLALENLDPAKPREAYFKHVDYIVDKAASLGLRIGFVPTWGDKWNKRWGKGPEIFNPSNARIYGEWLGKRYRDKPIIWILGADRPVENDQQRAILRAIAEGLKAGDGGRHLISFHPQGRKNSSEFWPDEPWLDFHQFQSGHQSQATHNFDYNAANLALTPLKPTLDGEPCYEDHPVRGLWKEGQAPVTWFNDFDARRAAWWSLLSGACGHVYGNHNIWQFYDGKREPVFFARTPWKKALDQPGAVQMGRMRAFLEKTDWQKLQRDDAFLLSNTSAGEQQLMAAVATDRSFAVVYQPDVKSCAIAPDFTKLAFNFAQSEAKGYDPATGEFFTPVITSVGVVVFTANMQMGTSDGETIQLHHDWVLLIQKKK